MGTGVLGSTLGCAVGGGTGAKLGLFVSCTLLGTAEPSLDATALGAKDSAAGPDGASVLADCGTILPLALGCALGSPLGSVLGSALGSTVGSADGSGGPSHEGAEGQITGTELELGATDPSLEVAAVGALLGAKWKGEEVTLSATVG